VAYQHVHDDVPAPSSLVDHLAQDLDDLVLWATARDPDDRPGDARELLAELREVRAALPAEDLDHETERWDEGAAVDGRTLVVGRRQHALALPVGDPEDDPADPAPTTTTDTAEQSWGYGPGGRRRRRGLLALVGALVLAVLLGSGGWWFTAGPGAYTTTPTLAGKTVDEARTLLKAEGLAAEVSDRYDDSVPAGVVLESDPAGGDRVHKGGTVDVFVSAGPESVPVPQLVGLPLEQAKQALADAGLTAGAVTEEFSEDVPAGSVVDQSVPAEQPQKRSVPVDLVVSKGPQPIDVPAVVGTPRAEAEQAVRAAGLAVGDVTEEPSESVPKGVVVRQAPEGGTLFRGDPVSLVVSSGPPLVAVPQVRGMQLEEAERVLHDAGFETKVEKLFGGIFGTVHSTDPAEGAQVPKGSTVTIRVV
jgi:serine/threonine-protein kinase